MKKIKVLYWITTIIIFLFEGVAPALTSNSQLAINGIKHLGYPDYFRIMLTCFKVAGALVLILPMVKGAIKEWAYAGFAFTMISACVSNWAVDGFSGNAIFPLIVLAILFTSYFSYKRIVANQNDNIKSFKVKESIALQ
jgi:hypothetical protein